MSVFLDSANPAEARQAMALGFVSGITTNPTIIAREKRPAAEIIGELLTICGGTIFHQLRYGPLDAMGEEAERFLALSPRQIGLKIPCTLTGLALAAQLSRTRTCAVTAIFSPAQALLAAEAGARYIIPYVNRSTRLLGDGNLLVSQMAAVCRASGRSIEIMAASLKSVDEVIGAVLNGAQHVTVPWNILQAMGEHPLSHQAIAEFDAAA